MNSVGLIHRGQIVKKAVVNSGIKISELSRKINKSRRFIYIMFDTELMPIHYVKQIGEVINYDFSKEITEIHNIENSEGHQDYWKDKYISLLEEHKELYILYLKKREGNNSFP